MHPPPHLLLVSKFQRVEGEVNLWPQVVKRLHGLHCMAFVSLPGLTVQTPVLNYL